MVWARVKTPAGPLFLDIAYGHRDRKLRWHFFRYGILRGRDEEDFQVQLASVLRLFHCIV